MTTPSKRWPMIGPPTKAAINASGFTRANPPATAEPRGSAGFNDGLRVAVALVTAKLAGIRTTPVELAGDVDPSAVIRALVLIVAVLMDSALTGTEVTDLLASLGLAAQERT